MISEQCRKAFEGVGVNLDGVAGERIAAAAERRRQPRKGDVIPCVEYDWDSHSWLIGFKDWKDQWIMATRYCTDYSDEHSAAETLRGLADALERKPHASRS